MLPIKTDQSEKTARLRPEINRQILTEIVWETTGALEPVRRLDGRTLVALDGTEFFRSRKIRCDNCSTRKRSDGGVEHFHQMLAATIVAPGQSRALPLPPEFVQPQDGAAKQDCERQAVKRWLSRHGPRCAALRPVYLGDDLYACQPVCRAMLDAGGDFLLTCKQPSHKTLYEYLDGIRPPTRRRTAGRGAKRRIHRYRWINDLPIRDGDDALRVNWLEITSARPNGTVTYRGAFVTSLHVDRDNVAELTDCARARWKIENETFNVLKQHGYHLEYNFGHGCCFPTYFIRSRGLFPALIGRRTSHRVGVKRDFPDCFLLAKAGSAGCRSASA